LIERNVVNTPEFRNIIVTESEVTLSEIASATPITVTVPRAAPRAAALCRRVRNPELGDSRHLALDV
jgi:hypothetical protein